MKLVAIYLLNYQYYYHSLSTDVTVQNSSTFENYCLEADT